jgi:hypothetical protein
VTNFLAGISEDLSVAEAEAREMAYHYIRIHMQERTRPARLQVARSNGYDEPVWQVELVSRTDGSPAGTLIIGKDTGSFYGAHAPLGTQAAH